MAKKTKTKESNDELSNINIHNTELPMLNLSYSNSEGVSYELVSKGYTINEAIKGLKFLLLNVQNDKRKKGII